MPAIYHEGSWLGNATDPEVLVKDTVGWTGKNRAYSQTNNAVIAHIENGITYDVSWTGSATVTLKKNSTSGATITSGSTSPLSFTADADYELYFGSSATVTNIMVKDSRITDPTYEPYHESVQNQLNAQGVLGAKNLLNVTANTQTLNGVTFTVNRDSDGNVINVTVNGTASANISFVLRTKTPLAAGKSYIMSRGEVGDNDFQMVATAWNNGSYVKNIIDVGAGGYTEKSFVADYNGYNDIQISIFVRSGKTISNAKVYPMLRLASDPDDTYQPYAMTNRELTEDRYYHAGDTVDVTGSTFGAFISGGATEIVFTIPLLKDLSKINGISFGATSRFSARTATGGYLFDTVNPNNYAVTIRKKVGNLLSLTIKKTDGSAFENGVNNSVLAIGFVTGSGQGSIITFS